MLWKGKEKTYIYADRENINLSTNNDLETDTSWQFYLTSNTSKPLSICHKEKQVKHKVLVCSLVKLREIYVTTGTKGFIVYTIYDFFLLIF